MYARLSPTCATSTPRSWSSMATTVEPGRARFSGGPAQQVDAAPGLLDGGLEGLRPAAPSVGICSNTSKMVVMAVRLASLPP